MTKPELNRILKSAGLDPKAYKCKKEIYWKIYPQPYEKPNFAQNMETLKAYLSDNGIKFFDKYTDCLQIYA